MKKLLSLLLSLSFLFALEDAKKGDLVVITEDFEDISGYAIVRIFRESDEITGKPYAMKINTLTDKTSKWVFEDLAFGTYAIFVLHDKNSNKEVDHNFFRLPSEPLAFSGSYKISLLSGKPTFEKMKFRFSKDYTIKTINFKKD